MEASAEDEQDQCLLAAVFAEAVDWAAKIAQDDADPARRTALDALKAVFGDEWDSEWCRGWKSLLPSAALERAAPLNVEQS